MNRLAYNPQFKPYNWLIFKIGEKILLENKTLFKGVVYDLGCGEKPYEQFILQSAEKYIGVDWGNTFHPLKAEIVADLNKPLQIKSEVADTIISLSVLEHLSEPQIMLNEAYRILKKGGNILLQVPWQWWIHEAPYDYYRFTPYGLKYIFKKAGFKQIKIQTQAGFFTMMVLKFNYFSTRLIRGTKFRKAIMLSLLIPIWYLGQKLAPYLDRFDHHWALEGSGFIVKAKK